MLPLSPSDFRGIPINNHPGAFGVRRKHDIHEGVDLYTYAGAEVLAMHDGVVIANYNFTGAPVGTPWWNETNALLVRVSGLYFVYGELESKCQPGDNIKKGDVIGHILPVLPENKIRLDIQGHSNAMLHLEKWHMHTTDVLDMQRPPWTDYSNRPNGLLDPTAGLITDMHFDLPGRCSILI